MGISFLLSDKKGTGKTAMAGVMMTLLRDSGKTVAYYKPFSESLGDDRDIEFISGIFGDLVIPEPVPIAQGSADEVARIIEAQLIALNTANDQVLVEMPDAETMPGAMVIGSASQWSSLDVKNLFVLRYHKGVDENFISSISNPSNDQIESIVFNQVTTHRIGELSRYLIPAVNSMEVEILGAIPEHRTMVSVTLRQIADHLDGSWLEPPLDLDISIAHFLIGGNIMDSGPNYFGRYPDQAVIVRAERPDIQMASLGGDTKCLILTGGGHPTEYVQVEAVKHQVPLFISSADTESMVAALNDLFSGSYPLDFQKLDSFKHLVVQYLDQKLLF